MFESGSQKQVDAKAKPAPPNQPPARADDATVAGSMSGVAAGVKAAVAAAAAPNSRLSMPGLGGRASMGFASGDVSKLRDQLTDLTM
jgi:hypothetical protein